ncbi:ATP-binding protein [Spirillospora sp. NPDC048911]|uniref:ATP-binding protein n=1 Tax=Spirillospora sp. NPDC048911 TaxID=3364527 RepID=UPI003724090D
MGDAMTMIGPPYLRLDLRLHGSEVSRAREATARALTDLGHLELVGDGQTVVSELVTNALHQNSRDGSPARHVPFVLYENDGRPLVEAWDAILGEVPRIKCATEEDLGGRGLLIVNDLAARWGYRHATLWPNGPMWKCVWALLK